MNPHCVHVRHSVYSGYMFFFNLWSSIIKPEGEDVVSSSPGCQGDGRKRKRGPSKVEEDDDDEEEGNDAVRSHPTFRHTHHFHTAGDTRGIGIHRKNPNKHEYNFDYGSEYRAKKAKGDMKQAGKPDPFAYVPLIKQKLDKRQVLSW